MRNLLPINSTELNQLRRSSSSVHGPRAHATNILTSAPDNGQAIHDWATDLFPICRSLTGEGNRQTLAYLTRLLPELQTHSVPSGTPAFDWIVPDEWNIHDAFIADDTGDRIVDFAKHNLHVVGYSEPIDEHFTLEQLKEHLHHSPEKPDAIPYVTSYYKRTWGFCINGEQHQRLTRNDNEKFHVRIDSTLQPGEMNYADLVLPGRSQQEVFFSTYICHPSMANNELSGPCVQTALARWIEKELPNRRLTYRFYFGPETIGAIHYLSQHLQHLQENVYAGFVLTCLGDERAYSCLTSPEANTLADRVALHVLQHRTENHKVSSFLSRGSDERQYCAPGVDLPMCVLARSIFHHYPEYHTSLDDLDVISPRGLEDSLTLLKEVVLALEHNVTPKAETNCEPQLGPRGLYPSLSKGVETRKAVSSMMDMWAYSNGERDLLEIAEKTHQYIGDLVPIAQKLFDAGVMSKVEA